MLEGGSDWQRALPDSVTLLDCRLVLETDDGALLSLSYTGVRAGPPEVLARLGAGAPVRADEYYLRISARFQTGAVGYDWLNRVVVVGAGQRLPAGPVYDLFEVL